MALKRQKWRQLGMVMATSSILPLILDHCAWSWGHSQAPVVSRRHPVPDFVEIPARMWAVRVDVVLVEAFVISRGDGREV
jgi:hypothetical protein